MSEATGTRRGFGAGPLSQAAAFIYTLVVVELLFLLTAAPGLVLLVLLSRDTSNLPLVAACALPLGPSLSAALYALRHRSRDLTDLRPAAAFWRGYRLNFRAALLVWVPLLAWLTIVGVTLANFTAAGVPGWWAVLLVLVAVAVTLCGANALVITSLFAFRAVDVARLAAYFLNACLLIVAVGVTAITSEAVLALLVSVFAMALLQSCRPMITLVKEEFTT